jgi:hypothetical protein
MSECGEENRLGQRGLSLLRRCGRNSSAAAALEFAIVAGPFLVLLFGIIAVALAFAANMTLENAVEQGARLIRTGQAQSQGFDAARFRTEVCKYLTPPLSCAGLKLDVRTCSNFGGCPLTNPLDSSGNITSGLSYTPGVGGDIIIVRAFYESDLLAKLPIMVVGNINIDTRLSNMPNGDRVLIATAVFRNEPFKL